MAQPPVKSLWVTTGIEEVAVKAYEVVLRHVEEAILAGQLSVGDLLPPERELAQQLGVSRSATREAIRALEAQGVLTSSVGAGPGSGTRVTDQQSKALTKLLRLQVALANFPVGDVVELRVALERVSVTLAAQRISEPALRRLRGVLDAMASPAVGLDAFNELDTEFHVLMSQAADNRLITDMTVAVRESMRLPILRASRQMGDWNAFRADLQRHHESIYEALAGRDAQRAADLVETHIRVAYTILALAPTPA